MKTRASLWLLSAAAFSCFLFAARFPSNTPAQFRFEILGDRTGEAVPGVFEEALHEAVADHPSFIITVGDSIQGGSNAPANTEWQQFEHILTTCPVPVYLTPGNHDIWSPESAALYEKYSHHPLHYSFDYDQAHFTVLNDHEDDPRAPLPPEEMSFLENDLRAHQNASLKFVFSHRPWWLLDALLKNTSETQRVAKRYGVQYFIAGHLHEMLHFRVDGVEYVSMPSAGGHLRSSKDYAAGWFFAHTEVDVQGNAVNFTIRELPPPFGQSRVTHLSDWGTAGLQAR